MKPSAQARSVGSFIATAALALFCFVMGTALLANWMIDSDGMPVDIAYPSE